MVEVSKGVYLFSCSFLHFVKNANYNSDSENFIEKIIGNLKDKYKMRFNITGNVLLAFENINWTNLQLLFKYNKIVISGGFNNKRHLLSTTDYSLTRFILILGYSLNDVFKSFNSFKVSVMDSKKTKQK